ncbi:MarR family winged helix-turn-helix transcriptional regulator [Saccharopolyspora sp. NPDC000359]|uniref:MarR family winged helix-turn-helix transcriptional regulator n=1 Tax=Saccharopolyspora sp. NPDC000359 TaxID=3154251 RepID=UPI003323D8F9
MTQDKRTLNDLERELSLFARHYLANRQVRAGQQLDRSGYLLLTRLEISGAMSLKQLAETFRLDISTINRQVGALLKQGLVERFPDPDGGLARKFRPTEEGLRLLAADRERSREGVEMVVSDWPQDELATFVTLLTRFNSDIEELEGNPWPREHGTHT